MDPHFKSYEAFRMDDILAYLQTDSGFILTTLIVHNGPFISSYTSDMSPLIEKGSFKNSMFLHPITEKYHTNLYHNGVVVMDGYGGAFTQLRLSGNTLYDISTNEYFEVHMNSMPSASEFQSNIENRDPSNVYGLIPDTNHVEISNETDFFATYAFTGMQRHRLISLYENPENIKNVIRTNVKINKEHAHRNDSH